MDDAEANVFLDLTSPHHSTVLQHSADARTERQSLGIWLLSNSILYVVIAVLRKQSQLAA